MSSRTQLWAHMHSQRTSNCSESPILLRKRTDDWFLTHVATTSTRVSEVTEARWDTRLWMAVVPWHHVTRAKEMTK